MYDLLIKGGKVLDPASKLNGQFDIAIAKGAIARVAPEIPAEEAHRVIEVGGKLVTPGIIDLHTHTAEGSTRVAVNPDLVGVHAGVTTVVDAGDCGCATFYPMVKYVIPNAKTEVLFFLNIARTGLSFMPEINDLRDIDLEETVRVARAYEGLVCGIKLRVIGPGVRSLGFNVVRLAKEAARLSQTRLIVHIGDWHDPQARYKSQDDQYERMARDVLDFLDPGDIVTHLFTSYPGGVLGKDDKVYPEVLQAKQRGVFLDAAHGRRNVSFDVARLVLDQGVVPDCISTDNSAPGRLTVVYSMTETMTRFLALGFSLEQVVTMTTINPAKALGLSDRLGTLAPGRQADVSVLELHQGKWTVTDAMGGKLTSDRALTPVFTVKRGEVFTPEWGPHPWGWLPRSA